jgi:hypothetical protein
MHWDEDDDSLNDPGAVYVFTRNGGVWSQQAYIKASHSNQGDSFGTVVLLGDTLVVGAPSEDGGSTGVGGDQGDNSADGTRAAPRLAPLLKRRW